MSRRCSLRVGRADLAARDELPYRVHTGLVHELDDAGLLADMSGAIIASDDDETNLIALGTLLEKLPRSRVWLMPGDQRSTEPPRVVAEVEQWTRAPFTAAPPIRHLTTPWPRAIACGRCRSAASRRRRSRWCGYGPTAAGPWAADGPRAKDRVVVLDGQSSGAA